MDRSCDKYVLDFCFTQVCIQKSPFPSPRVCVIQFFGLLRTEPLTPLMSNHVGMLTTDIRESILLLWRAGQESFRSVALVRVFLLRFNERVNEAVTGVRSTEQDVMQTHGTECAQSRQDGALSDHRRLVCMMFPQTPGGTSCCTSTKTRGGDTQSRLPQSRIKNSVKRDEFQT